MNKKDIMELKRRFKKEACTFTRMCGCYVSVEKEKITKIAETFLNLEDEEFYKYLEIAKKTLSGNIGNNLVELAFPREQEAAGGKQQFLMGLRESKLKNDDLLDTFYDMIIDNYDRVGNYLILIFHDAYDVMTKTSDNDKLDESEEVYEYLLCAICPVELTKPALGYREAENRIGARIRDWVVGMPETGFVFPAFTDRSTDIHSVMFYTKNTVNPHVEFEDSVLGCMEHMTSDQKKVEFAQIVKDVVGDDDDEETIQIYNEVQDTLNEVLQNEQEKAEESSTNEPDEPLKVVLTEQIINEVLEKVNLFEDQKEAIKKSCADVIPEDTEVAEIIDEKAIKAAEQTRYLNKLKELLLTAAEVLEKKGETELVREIRDAV